MTGSQLDGLLTAVETTSAWLVAPASDPEDWLVRFEKTNEFPAREWAQNMIGVYNRRRASEDG